MSLSFTPSRNLSENGQKKFIIALARLPYILSLNLPQSNQLLGASRVNGHTAIKVLLGSTHLHGDTEALEHLTDTKAKDVQTNHLLLGAGANNLHLGGVLGLLFGRHNAVVHGGELGVVDLDLVITVLLAGFGLGETDAANLGVGENNGRDVLIGKLGGLQLGRAEKAVAKLTTGGNSN